MQHEDHANTKRTLGAVFIRMRAQSRGLLLQLTDRRGVGGSAMDEEATAYGSRKEELAKLPHELWAPASARHEDGHHHLVVLVQLDDP